LPNYSFQRRRLFFVENTLRGFPFRHSYDFRRCTAPRASLIPIESTYQTFSVVLIHLLLGNTGRNLDAVAYYIPTSICVSFFCPIGPDAPPPQLSCFPRTAYKERPRRPASPVPASVHGFASPLPLRPGRSFPGPKTWPPLGEAVEMKRRFSTSVPYPPGLAVVLRVSPSNAPFRLCATFFPAIWTPPLSRNRCAK